MPASRAAPVRSTWPAGEADVDGEGTRTIPARASRASTATNQKSTAGPATSTSGPAATMPSAPPKPNIALSAATTPPSRSAGTVWRASPKAQGKTPPESPCSTRPVTTPGYEPSGVLTAATTEPASSSARPVTRRRRWPNWSPSRPATGVATAEASMKAVKSQVAPVAETSSSRANTVSAASTIVCAIATPQAASSNTGVPPPAGRRAPPRRSLRTTNTTAAVKPATTHISVPPRYEAPARPAADGPTRARRPGRVWRSSGNPTASHRL